MTMATKFPKAAGLEQLLALQRAQIAAATASPTFRETLSDAGGVAVGDAIGTAASADGTVEKATTQPFVGLATASASAGSTVPVQTTGLIPAAITGLAAGVEAYAVVDSTTGKLARKASRGAGDNMAGTVDTAGNVSIGAFYVDKIAAKAMAGDFGAKPSATGTDNGAKLQLAVNAAALATDSLCGPEGGSGGHIEIDGGAYYASTACTLDSGASSSCDGMHVTCGTLSGASGAGLASRLLFNGATPRTGAAGTITAFDGATYKATFGGLTGMTANDVNTVIYVTGGSHAAQNRGGQGERPRCRHLTRLGANVELDAKRALQRSRARHDHRRPHAQCERRSHPHGRCLVHAEHHSRKLYLYQ
jgi:hypothetical protein